MPGGMPKVGGRLYFLRQGSAVCGKNDTTKGVPLSRPPEQVAGCRTAQRGTAWHGMPAQKPLQTNGWGSASWQAGAPAPHRLPPHLRIFSREWQE